MNAQELAEANWEYIESLLLVHGETPSNVGKVGFHYRTAFVHGFKHGIEAAKEKNRIREEDDLK
jgi:hypothetical protein